MNSSILSENIDEVFKKLQPHKAGQMRSKKGSTVESVGERILRHTWCSVMGQSPDRLETNNKKISYDFRTNSGKIPHDPRILSAKTGIGLDLFVYIDGTLAMAGESKAYCDISMLKRAYSEFESIYVLSKDVRFFVFQVENAVGGKVEENPRLSFSSHAHLFSKSINKYINNKRFVNPNCHFDFDFLTLLCNKRNSTKDFSLKEELTDEGRLDIIISYFKNSLGGYV